jgi:fucose 4-O-acetylase-like acetyltransferase
MKPAADSAGPTDWVVIAKGVGIILVVIGHFHPPQSPRGWEEMRSIVYSFHMPLFFALSGYLYFNGKYLYRALIVQKAKRLLVPYLTIAVAFCAIKLVAIRYVALDEPVTLQSLINVVIDPINSYAPLLWFLQALFLIFCVYPLLRRFLNEAAIIVLFIAVNEVFGSRYPLFGRVVANLPFFAFGILLRKSLPTPKFDTGRFAPALSLLAFALGCLLQLTASRELARDYLEQFTLAAVGILLVFNISAWLGSRRRKGLRALMFSLGLYSMTIYVVHTVFEGGARIALMHLAGRLPLPFWVVALLAVAAGLVGPMGLEVGLIRRSAIARRLILGTD